MDGGGMDSGTGEQWEAWWLAEDDLLLKPGQRQRRASRQQKPTYEAGVGVIS